mmetsp:Transcript_37068/g.81012  ORF Transcript_37068/g.81012 Transcript_37068/m.81012 type:complete len:239 (+) Transcript_37068:30-746(+)
MARSPLPSGAADHYAVLGLGVDATRVEIRQKYLLLCRQHHPDKAGDSQAAHQDAAALNEAKEVLLGPRRAAYDCQWRRERGFRSARATVDLGSFQTDDVMSTIRQRVRAFQTKADVGFRRSGTMPTAPSGPVHAEPGDDYLFSKGMAAPKCAPVRAGAVTLSELRAKAAREEDEEEDDCEETEPPVAGAVFQGAGLLGAATPRRSWHSMLDSVRVSEDPFGKMPVDIFADRTRLHCPG